MKYIWSRKTPEPEEECLHSPDSCKKEFDVEVFAKQCTAITREQDHMHLQAEFVENKENITQFPIENSSDILVMNQSIEENFDFLNGYDFEKFCANILKSNGFKNVIITSCSGDYGADIIAEQNNIKYAIQCKCYSSDVGIDAVYQISGGMQYYNANVGIVLTNRNFTHQAEELAEKIGVVLWNRSILLKLIQNESI